MPSSQDVNANTDQKSLHQGEAPISSHTHQEQEGILRFIGGLQGPSA